MGGVLVVGVRLAVWGEVVGRGCHRPGLPPRDRYEHEDRTGDGRRSTRDLDRLTALELQDVEHEDRMRAHLEATWADHEDRQWKGTPILHLYGTDSAGHWHEIGNYQLEYDGPVSAAQPVARAASGSFRTIGASSRA